jgi:hypothetical protein
MNNKTPTYDFEIVNSLVDKSKKEKLHMNNFTKGLLVVLAIALPVAMTAPSVQAMTPNAVPAAKVNKHHYRTKMHKHHYRHSALKSYK